MAIKQEDLLGMLVPSVDITKVTIETSRPSGISVTVICKVYKSSSFSSIFKNSKSYCEPSNDSDCGAKHYRLYRKGRHQGCNLFNERGLTK
jgi:hypothetical protein